MAATLLLPAPADAPPDNLDPPAAWPDALEAQRAFLASLESACTCKATMRPTCCKDGKRTCKQRKKDVCICPRWPGPPCFHRRAKGEWTLYRLRRAGEDACPLEEAPGRWAALLRRAWGPGSIASGKDDYEGKHLKPYRGTLTVTREDRIALLEYRYRKKMHLWHPEDKRLDPVMAIVWRRVEIEEEGVKKIVRREFLVNVRKAVRA